MAQTPAGDGSLGDTHPPPVPNAILPLPARRQSVVESAGAGTVPVPGRAPVRNGGPLPPQSEYPALELALAKISTAALAELLELVARALHSRGYAEDLFPAQWVALRYFARTAPERRTASDLARFQGFANGPVSRTVRTLVHKGLLAKSEIQPRGRAERLEVTPAGLKVLETDPNRQLEIAIRGLEESDQEAMARALETVLRRISSAER